MREKFSNLRPDKNHPTIVARHSPSEECYLCIEDLRHSREHLAQARPDKGRRMVSRSLSRTLHYFGENRVNASGASAKYYVIGAREGVVHIFHGPCEFVKGKITPTKYTKITYQFISADEAINFLIDTVNKKSKPNGPYELTPRAMRPKLNVFGEKPARKYSKKRISVEILLKQIAKVEKVDVVMRSGGRRVRSDRKGMPSYNSLQERQLAGTSTIAALERRLQKHYPEFSFDVLNGDGSIVKARNTKLRRVRDSY